VRVTRRHVLAAGPLTALLAASASAEQRSDAELLEGLLVHETRLAAAYEAALRRGAIERRLGETLRDHEHEHARALTTTLRREGRRAPRAAVPDPRLGAALGGGREDFARYALELEGRTVRAYVEALAALGNARLRPPLGAIMTSGAQHEVALRVALGEPLLPV
jgi:hypothetical protein